MLGAAITNLNRLFYYFFTNAFLFRFHSYTSLDFKHLQPGVFNLPQMPPSVNGIAEILILVA